MGPFARLEIRFLVVMCTVLLASCAPDSVDGFPTDEIVVREVVDGDTIVVTFPNGQDETIRLLGIDTPETVDPSRPQQCFGREATEFLTNLVPSGTAIWLERDAEARDRFGRLLAYAYRSSDDLFINAALLEGGFADLAIFEPNDAHSELLTSAVTLARTRSAGLWGQCGGPDIALDPAEYN